jgi:hypothetical protein
MKVTPEMLMKTKGDGKQVAEESGLRAGIGGFRIRDSTGGAKPPYEGISQKCLKIMRRMIQTSPFERQSSVRSARAGLKQ